MHLFVCGFVDSSEFWNNKNNKNNKENTQFGHMASAKARLAC